MAGGPQAHGECGEWAFGRGKASCPALGLLESAFGAHGWSLPPTDGLAWPGPALSHAVRAPAEAENCQLPTLYGRLGPEPTQGRLVPAPRGLGREQTLTYAPGSLVGKEAWPRASALRGPPAEGGWGAASGWEPGRGQQHGSAVPLLASSVAVPRDSSVRPSCHVPEPTRTFVRWEGRHPPRWAQEWHRAKRSGRAHAPHHPRSKGPPSLGTFFGCSRERQ